MECFIVSREDITGSDLTIRGEEAHHALKSLRLRPGESLLATDLDGTSFECKYIGETEKNLNCQIVRVLPNFGEPSRDVLLIQGMIAQPARWEFLLEKATELGVTSIMPVITEWTEQRHLRIDRADRILRAAVKQTKRSRLPNLIVLDAGEMMSFEEGLVLAKQQGREIILLHDEAAESLATSTSQSIALVVGPEGGFTPDEIALARDQFGARLATLGSRRLRAETAAIAALAVLSL